MCLYWTFPHEAINGVLKGFACRNSNHRNVGNSLMRRHFLLRYLDIALGTETIPLATKVLRQGKKLSTANPLFQELTQQRRVTEIHHDIGYQYKWQYIWPGMMIIFCDHSVWLSKDVVYMVGRIWIWAQRLEYSLEVEATGYPAYSLSTTRQLIPVDDVLHVGAFSRLDNGTLYMKTYENK